MKAQPSHLLNVSTISWLGASAVLSSAIVIGGSRPDSARPSDGGRVAVYAQDAAEAELGAVGLVVEQLSRTKIDTVRGEDLSGLVLQRINERTPWPLGEAQPAEYVAILDLDDTAESGIVTVRRVSTTQAVARATWNAQDKSAGDFSAWASAVVSLVADPPRVISSRRGGLVINTGTDRGLRSDQVLEVFIVGDEQIDLETGELMPGTEELVGRIRLTSAVERLAEAEVISGDRERIRVGSICRPLVREAEFDRTSPEALSPDARSGDLPEEKDGSSAGEP